MCEWSMHTSDIRILYQGQGQKLTKCYSRDTSYHRDTDTPVLTVPRGLWGHTRFLAHPIGVAQPLPSIPLGGLLRASTWDKARFPSDEAVPSDLGSAHHDLPSE
jgi:hypothetical protein